MITFDPNSLSTAEVELLEFTITEQMAPLRKMLELPPKIYTFGDITRAFQSLGSNGEPTADGVPMGIVLRAVELLDLRKKDSSASWADTGTNNLIAEVVSADQSEVAAFDPPAAP